MSESPRPTRPAPLRTEDNHRFWDAADAGRLIAQRCDSCAALHHPPRVACPACGGLTFVDADLCGLGTVYSYSFLHHPQHPAFDYPVAAALVDLDEGVRLLTNLVGVGSAEASIGMRVAVEFATVDGGGHVPVFRPIDGGGS